MPRGDSSAAGRQGDTEWQVTLNREVASGITERARAERVTVGTMFQAAWAILLGKLSRRDDVVFGVTMSGRPPEIEGVEHIVGTFVNNVPIRARLERSQRSREFVSTMQLHASAAAEHQFVPLSQIQRLSRVPAKDRLFESLLVVQNYLGAGWAAASLGDAQIVSVDAPIRTGYPITVVVTPAPELKVSLIARDLGWPDRLGKLILDEFARVVTSLATGHSGKVGDLLQAGEDFAEWPVKRAGTTAQATTHTAPRTPLETEIFAVFENG